MGDVDVQTSAAALSAGSAAPIGRYEYDAEGWTWSDTLYDIHGFASGEVVPSSELMISHQDPDDITESREAFKQALSSDEPFASYHHIIDAQQRRRTVLVSGQGSLDEQGNLVALHGFMVDLTDVSRADRELEVRAGVAGVAEHRGVIEQAKGILMLALGVTADEAFAVLRTQSQDRNIKLNELAAHLVAAVASVAGAPLADGETKQRVLAALEALAPSQSR